MYIFFSLFFYIGIFFWMCLVFLIFLSITTDWLCFQNYRNIEKNSPSFWFLIFSLISYRLVDKTYVGVTMTVVVIVISVSRSEVRLVNQG